VITNRIDAATTTRNVVGRTLLLVPVPNRLLTWAFPIWVATTSAILLIRRDRVEAATPGH
jgi:hypothetical protein